MDGGASLAKRSCRSGVNRSTYPGQQSLPLGHMVDEFQGPGRAVDAAVHIPVKVQQSHFLFFAAVRWLHLWASRDNKAEQRSHT